MWLYDLLLYVVTVKTIHNNFVSEKMKYVHIMKLLFLIVMKIMTIGEYHADAD